LEEEVEKEEATVESADPLQKEGVSLSLSSTASSVGEGGGDKEGFVEGGGGGDKAIGATGATGGSGGGDKGTSGMKREVSFSPVVETVFPTRSGSSSTSSVSGTSSGSGWSLREGGEEEEEDGFNIDEFERAHRGGDDGGDGGVRAGDGGRRSYEYDFEDVFGGGKRAKR
jgi:hypothetical protein